jgi:hypothetical protein
MGIHGNSTCQISLDGATGWLIGEPNKGLNAMFVMMNAARLGVGMQSLGLTEGGLPERAGYARERLQMRSLSGVKAPDKPADPIIVHPDVRRMLLTARAYAEGGRAFSSFIALMIDRELSHPDEEVRKDAADLVTLLTPIIKAFMTDNGWIAVSEAMQVHGGSGFITGTGVEQYVRDARINMIYEGTNTVQSLDLLGRKVLMDNGTRLKKFGALVQAFVEENGTDEAHERVRHAAGRSWRQGQQADHGNRHEGFPEPGRGRCRRRALSARGRPPGLCLLLRPHGEDRTGEAGFRRCVLQGQAGNCPLLLCATVAGDRYADPAGTFRRQATCSNSKPNFSKKRKNIMSNFIVRKVAVLGAGVMGAQIAAHCVNARVPVVLFDLPAKEGPKNGIVLKAIEGLKKLKPGSPGQQGRCGLHRGRQLRRQPGVAEGLRPDHRGDRRTHGLEARPVQEGRPLHRAERDLCLQYVGPVDHCVVRGF